ncbi:hypothetical protein [Rhodopirellula sp. SWK7]|uniref:hypothetical protein n=1 Tax=Rhodopirellula sp. SWK7 TaxID=595460 RepID=UPI0002BF8D1E|nr:hypothetical protein [Rhodopirellula sp. SWK7]EMI46631.1 membrane protein [Rhodopirellula sp. SWK7]
MSKHTNLLWYRVAGIFIFLVSAFLIVTGMSRYLKASPLISKGSTSGYLFALFGLLSLPVAAILLTYKESLDEAFEGESQIDAEPARPIEDDTCLECGARYIEEDSACPQCGWSFEDYRLDSESASDTIVVPLHSETSREAWKSFSYQIYDISTTKKKNLVLDLRALTEVPDLHFGYFLDDIWINQTKNGNGMSIVLDPALAEKFKLRVFERSPIAHRMKEAKDFANRRPTVPAISDEFDSQLSCIEYRFEELVKSRIGHLWENGEPPYPPIVNFYKCAVYSGHFPFPYGVYQWRFETTGDVIVLHYDDFARIAGGWGCRYEITQDKTKMTEEGLD